MVQQLTARLSIDGGVKQRALDSLRGASQATSKLSMRSEEAAKRSQALQQRMQGLDRGTAEYRRLERAARRYDETQARLVRRARRLDRLTRGLRVAAAAGAALGATSFGVVLSGINQLSESGERLQQLRFELPTLDDADLLDRADAYRRYGIDAERALSAERDALIRLGEIQAGEVNLAIAEGAGLDVEGILRSARTGEDAIFQLIDATQHLDNAARAAVFDEVLGGTAGEVAFAYSQMGFSVNDLADALDAIPRRTQANLDAMTSITRGTQTASDAYTRFKEEVGTQLADPTGVVLTGVTELLNRTTEYIQVNDDFAARVLVAGGSAATASVGIAAMANNNLGLIVGLQAGLPLLGKAASAAQAAGGAINFAAFATRYYVATGLIPMIKGIPAGIAGLYGMAAAGWAAIAPFLPFIAIGVAVVATIAAIAFGVKWLADQVGGFGNLWDLTWQGIQLGFLVYARGILTPLGWIIDGMNAVIRGANALGGALGIESGIGQIRNPIDDLDREIAARSANLQMDFRDFREQGRAQQAARGQDGTAPQTPQEQAARGDTDRAVMTPGQVEGAATYNQAVDRGMEVNNQFAAPQTSATSMVDSRQTNNNITNNDNRRYDFTVRNQVEAVSDRDLVRQIEEATRRALAAQLSARSA